MNNIFCKTLEMFENVENRNKLWFWPPITLFFLFRRISMSALKVEGPLVFALTINSRLKKKSMYKMLLICEKKNYCKVFGFEKKKTVY